jgi:hypothetical protein
MMEAARISEMLVNFYQTTRSYNVLPYCGVLVATVKQIRRESRERIMQS